MPSKPRLFVDHPLAEGQGVPLTPEQSHYLVAVMRLGAGAVVSAFNGRDGEWDASLADASRRAALLSPLARTRPQERPPDLHLLFAPIKKARTDFIVEKACEMGCRRIRPVRTERTQSERLNPARLRAHAIEAAEQCGNVFVPDVDDLVPLVDVLAAWEPGRALWFCDEALAGETTLLPSGGDGPGAILIGPEGGFSDAERSRLRALPFAHPIRLGPRILRADTAAVAALALWQATRGDWR